MINRIVFYLRYAARNLVRSGRWTIFGVFCIAAGVATVVALRSLGLAIGDSLVANVRSSNHGDISITRGGGGFFSSNFVGGDDDFEYFSERQTQAVERWAEENGARITAYINNSNFQITRVDEVTVGRPQFVSAFLVDPASFPLTGDIRAVDPAGVPLGELLTNGNTVVISANLAEAQGIAVGDTVRVSGTEEPYMVSGIVPTEVEANLRNPFASFFGFAYLDIADAEKLQLEPWPNSISAILPDGTPPETIEAAGRELNRLTGGAGDVTTTPQLLRQNTVIADYIGRFIVVMGLGALLIGGVGIINTMLVMVGRRTPEIAALKTFGLKGPQVVSLFLAEAFLLGIAGSIVGTIAGIGLSGLVNSYGEAFLQQRLAFRIHPEAIAYGLGLGMIVTLVFGVLPILTANRVRPATILRPNETVVPAAGCLQSLIALLAVILIIGGVAGQILGLLWVGIVGVAVALLLMGLLVVILWVVVWLVSRLPSFGWVDLRLALRNLTSRRVRTATTLLALSLGMFALSSIAFVGAGTREILQFQLAQQLGGNVMVFPTASLLSPQIGQALFETQAAATPGVVYYTTLENYDLELLLVNGEEIEFTLPFGLDPEEVDAAEFKDIGNQEILVTMARTTNPNPQTPTVTGRYLTPEDEGRQVLVISQSPRWEQLGVTVGSMLTLRVGGRPLDFEVVGITSTGGMSFGGQNVVPSGSLPGERTQFTLNVLQTTPESLNEVLLAFQPPVYVSLDITFIDGLIGRLINQFSAIPTLVGLLSLLAAAVIMANTVSLATLERRRQIGILKAIGLKGRRVLRIMLLENTLVGLLGGLLGIGLSALGVALMTSLSQGVAIPVPRDAAPTAIALVIASVVIAWVATFASASVAIRERVTNILRYE